MNKETAKKIVELAKQAKADRWYLRRPPAEMVAQFGSSTMRPFIAQKREGDQPYDQDVLGEDYGDNDELRDAHQAFIIAAAENIAALAQYYLDAEEEKS